MKLTEMVVTGKLAQDSMHIGSSVVDHSSQIALHLLEGQAGTNSYTTLNTDIKQLDENFTYSFEDYIMGIVATKSMEKLVVVKELYLS